MTDAHRRWLLSEWQRLFDDIYGSANRASGEIGIVFRMLEEVGEVVKECRSRNSAQLKYHLPDIVAWLCALCSVRGLRLTDVVWERYRVGCPSCRSRPCVCMPVATTQLPRLESPRTSTKRDRKAAHSAGDLFVVEDRTVDQWEEDLNSIYGARNNSLEWIDIAARVTEHTAGIAKIIRQRQDVEELRRRIADAFAWTLASWNSADSVVANSQYNQAPLCPDVRALYADGPTDGTGTTFISFAGAGGVRDPSRKWGHYDSELPVYVLGTKIPGRVKADTTNGSYTLQIKNYDFTYALGLGTAMNVGEEVSYSEFNTMNATINLCSPCQDSSNPVYWWDFDSDGDVDNTDFNVLEPHVTHNC